MLMAHNTPVDASPMADTFPNNQQEKISNLICKYLAVKYTEQIISVQLYKTENEQKGLTEIQADTYTAPCYSMWCFQMAILKL